LNILQAAPLDTAGPADIAFVLPRKARREAAADGRGETGSKQGHDIREVW